MNVNAIKGILGCVFFIVLLTGVMVFIYDTVSLTIIAIIKKEDYIYFDVKQIPLFLLLPVMILMDLFFICLILPVPYGKVIAKTILQKLTIPATVYGVIALVIGLIVSMVISVYPLSTEYYQCKSTSIVSSGSPYAKTKEMCKQRAYISTNEEERSSGIPEKDRLESPEQ